MIEIITPRMRAALESGCPLFHAADLRLSVDNGVVDSQADWKASKQQSNMDFDTLPGSAILATELGVYDISQTAWDTEHQCVNVYAYYAWQSVKIVPSRYLSKAVLNVRNSDATYAKTLWILIYDNYLPPLSDPRRGLVWSKSVTVPAAHNGVIEFIPSSPIFLPNGTYWIQSGSGPREGGASLYLRYKASDIYADGRMDIIAGNQSSIQQDVGDLYFDLDLSGYAASGSFRTKRLDLGKVPLWPGSFRMAYSLPEATSMNITAEAYDSATGTMPVWTLENAPDGAILPAGYRYWEFTGSFYGSADRAETPLVDILEVLFPRDRIRLIEKIRLAQADQSSFKEYAALLRSMDFARSALDPIERVATGGGASAVLEDPTGETVQRIVSNSPLKNHQAELYLGADYPGFAETDLLRVFIGTVEAAKPQPGFRGEPWKLPLTFKNPLTAMKRKIPQVRATGEFTLADYAIDWDGKHVMQAMVDAVRGEADYPARYVNMRSFYDAMAAIGDANLPAAAYIIRRASPSGKMKATPGAVANANNTGNGTCADITANPAAQVGIYTLTATGASAFSVTAPNGAALPAATVGTEYEHAQLTFLLSAGTVAFVSGDKFTIEVLSPDTRIKDTVELVEVMKDLCTIADGYVLIDDSSRIAFVKHDAAAAPAADWADEDMVKAGVNALPIERWETCDLGYDRYHFVAGLMACEWTGQGDSWENFCRRFSYINQQAADDFAPGAEVDFTIMEKNLKGPSKYLGSESHYNGAAIAQALVKRYVDRFAYPPVIITGAVLPRSQYIRRQGDVVRVWSRRFTKFKRRGIALSETLRFMILNGKLNDGRGRMVFDLLELT